MLRSMKAGRQVLDDVDADVVVGFGGYVAVPAYLAAWRRHTPIVIHELNVPPGVANRLGMRFTKHVAVGFPHQPKASPLLADARVVGVPLRPAIATLNRAASRVGAREHFGLDPDRPTLFVFGASQGAGRSTSRSPGRRRRFRSPGSRCCTSPAPATSRSRSRPTCPPLMSRFPTSRTWSWGTRRRISC
jgi:UDP-N-acetylglucosamine--N-acetylmuramyl-(pentapeptide) pyrophosphoryl-undecaprenol N-acetylglucosamine transferase